MSIKTPELVEVFNSAKTSHAITINGETTVYSTSVDLRKAEYFGVFFKAASGGTINLKLELQQSVDNVNWSDPIGMPDIDSSITDDTLYSKTLPVVFAPYLRFKITGLTGNAATTTLSIYLAR